MPVSRAILICWAHSGALHCTWTKGSSTWTKGSSTRQNYSKMSITIIIGLVDSVAVLSCLHRVIPSVRVLWLFLLHRWGKRSTYMHTLNALSGIPFKQVAEVCTQAN